MAVELLSEKVLQSDPPVLTAIYDRMFTMPALKHVDTFLAHERSRLEALISRSEKVKTIVVVGSGPNIYVDIAEKNDKNYIGIDPYVNYKSTPEPNMTLLNDFFENIDRNALGSETCLFVFWFNVMHYLKNPIEKIKQLLLPGDIIFHSTWAHTQAAELIMGDYFKKTHQDHTVSQFIISKIFDDRIDLGDSLSLERLIFDNNINRVEIVFNV